MAKKRRGPGRVASTRHPGSPHRSGTVSASARSTQRAPAHRLRPRWHRVAGWPGVLLGVVIAASNDLMLLYEDVTLLPGGHSELYLFAGIGVSIAATWFLGLFDRETTIYE